MNRNCEITAVSAAFDGSLGPFVRETCRAIAQDVVGVQADDQLMWPHLLFGIVSSDKRDRERPFVRGGHSSTLEPVKHPYQQKKS